MAYLLKFKGITEVLSRPLAHLKSQLKLYYMIEPNHLTMNNFNLDFILLIKIKISNYRHSFELLKH